MNNVINSIVSVAIHNKIQKVILFGSRARGDHNEKSDYDIAFVSSSLTTAVKSRILCQIDDIETFHKIDAVFLHDLFGSDELTQNILRDGVMLMNKFQTKFSNLKNAVDRLEEAISTFDELNNEVIRDGAIQRFEFSTELAWKSIREYLLSEHVSDINTPKSVMREAFAANIISEEQGWIQVLNDRNSTSHIYSETEADEIFDRIRNKHISLFKELINKLDNI